MRELKFRAWSKKNTEMLHPDDVAVMPINDGVSPLSISGEAIRIRPDNDQFVLMQYTGLKDWKDVEIYEGDIVRLTDDWDNQSVHQVEYCAEYDYPAFDVKPHIDAESNGLSHFMATGEIEVIGNIYEHGNLLENESKE